jgi:hypothetical protein
MERNDFSPDGSTAGAADAVGTFGQAGNSPGAGMGSASTQSDASGMGDRARDFAGVAKDKLADVGSATRERAGNLKDSLANALESSAEKLRQRGNGGQLSGAATSGSVALENDGRMGDVATRVAGGMDATAGWLRDADLDGLKSGIERQVKEHPGRTLLIAVGLGYLLGKALRK